MENLKMMGKRIAAAREGAKLSQDELAVKAGITRAFISRIETGKSPRVSVESIIKIAKALSMPPSYFIDEEITLETIKALDSIKAFLKSQERVKK